MMCRFGLLVLFSLVVVLTCSCRQSEVSRCLAQADALMEMCPDSALILLSDIDVSSLGRADRAYYNLLVTQGRIKCDIPLGSESMIKEAYDFYYDSGEGCGDRMCRSALYCGMLEYESGNYQDAMKYGLIAYDDATSRNEPLWIARSAELIADIFFRVYNYGQDEIYRVEALTNYLKAGRERNHRFALLDLAATLLNNPTVPAEKSIELLDSLMKVSMSQSPLDSILLKHIVRLSIVAYDEYGKYDSMPDGYLEWLKHPETIEDSLEFAIIRLKLDSASENVPETQEPMLFAREDADVACVLYAKYEAACRRGDYRSAAMMCDTLLQMQSDIAEKVLAESVMGIQRDFYSTRAVLNERRAKTLRLFLLLTITAVIIIGILIYLIYVYKIKAEQTDLAARLESLKDESQRLASENDRLLDEISISHEQTESLSKALIERKTVDEAGEARMEALFREKWNTLNMLCDEFYENDDSPAARAAILSNIKKELRKQRAKKNLVKIEEAVNLYLGNIVVKLRSECGFLKEDDILFLTLVFAGFSVRAVCLFTEIKYKNFYLKKSRLSKKIAESDVEHKGLFLSKISIKN